MVLKPFLSFLIRHVICLYVVLDQLVMRKRPVAMITWTCIVICAHYMHTWFQWAAPSCCGTAGNLSASAPALHCCISWWLARNLPRNNQLQVWCCSPRACCTHQVVWGSSWRGGLDETRAQWLLYLLYNLANLVPIFFKFLHEEMSNLSVLQPFAHLHSAHTCSMLSTYELCWDLMSLIPQFTVDMVCKTCMTNRCVNMPWKEAGNTHTCTHMY